ncbi:MAG TPA: hypothetical protein VGF67_18445 [Ktedonobacteraceae bacterium]|jgi:hypothetical protein
MDEKSIPAHASVPATQPQLSLTFALIADEQAFDPALLTTLGRDTVAALQQEGYCVKPSAYTGQKGSESFLVDVLTTIQQIALFVGNNHAVIAEGIADSSGLLAIFGAVVPVFKHLRKAHEQRIGKPESTARPIKMTIDIDGASLVIETSDLDQADAALKLALKYRTVHPAQATRVHAQSKIRVQGQVPARQKRRRR